MSFAKSQPKQKQDKFTLRVKTALLHRGWTITQLAKELSLARNTVSISINHPSMLPTVKTRISQLLSL